MENEIKKLLQSKQQASEQQGILLLLFIAAFIAVLLVPKNLMLSLGALVAVAFILLLFYQEPSQGVIESGDK